MGDDILHVRHFKPEYFFLADVELISLEDWEASKTENREAASISKKWITVQHRIGRYAGAFEKNDWKGYKKGFGSTKTNYWMGLEKLHQLTSKGKWDVFFSFSRKSRGTATLICRNFRVESELHYYRLHLGTCGSMHTSNLKFYKSLPKDIATLSDNFFSTKDKDHDEVVINEHNCAKSNGGGFWYTSCCYQCAPTGNEYDETKMAIRPA